MNIVITGASKGIGREVTLRFAADPTNRILAIARSEKLLKSLSGESRHDNISTLPADINKLASEPEKLLKQLKSLFKEVDILINNAGYLVPKPFVEMNHGDDDKVLATNFLAPMRLTRALLPYIKAKGHIVNISSMSGYQGSSKYPGLSVYGAAKGALAILGESLATELGSSGPSINSP